MGRFLLTPLTLILFSATYTFGQTQFWSDDFEDVGSPSAGTRLASAQNSFGGPPATRYFFRVAPSAATIATQNGPYTGFSNAKVWAAEDIDAALTGVNNGQAPGQSITWSGINISGKTGLSFRGLFACNQVGGSVWDGPTFPIADYMIVEYSINGGAWTSALRFFSNNAAGGSLALETTGDSVAEGTVIPNMTFTEFTANIVGTGTTLDLRFKGSSNGATTEEFAIDNFRLYYTGALPVELTSFTSECAETEEIIRWTSETEKDFARYTLERSVDGEEFERVADIEPKGAHDKPASYAFPVPGTESTVYYRLKMTDLNGTFRYSWIIASKNCLQEKQLLQSFAIEEDRLTCFFNAPYTQYELLSVSGVPVIPKTDSGGSTKHMTQLDVRSGVYLLQITNALGTQREVYRIFVP